MYARLSKSIVSKLAEQGLLKADRAIYEYGLEMCMASVFNALSVLILGLAFGQPISGIIFLAAFIPLRSSAGGFHASTHSRCYTMSMLCLLVFFVSNHFIPAEFITVLCSVFTGCSAVAILLLAPVGTPNKLLSTKEKKRFRAKCIAIFLVESLVLLSFVLLSLDSLAFAVSCAHLLVTVLLISGSIAIRGMSFETAET